MSLIEVVRAALTSTQQDVGESLTDRIGALKERFGSGRAAARAAGIPESTFRRMAKTGRAKPTNTERVGRAVRVNTTLTDGALTIKATDRTSGRERTITAQQLKLAPGTVERMREAYLRGDDQGAAKALLDGITSPWYKGWLTPGSALARTGTGDGEGGGPQAAAGRRDRDDQAAGGGGGGAGGGDGAGGWDGGDDYEDDWTDLAYEGEDVDSDYGATIGGIA